MTYYIKGGSRYNEANPTVWCALNLLGFIDSKYADVNWKQIDYEGIIDNQDPFWLMGSATGGAKELELGLYGDYRIKFETTGITYWDGADWVDLLAEGGATTLNELTDVVIDGTPANNELLAYDTTTSKWINQTGTQAGLSLSGHTHAQLHDRSHTYDSGSDHSGTLSWTNVNKTGSNLTDLATRQHAGLTDITSDQHHPQSHDNTYHSTNYEAANANIQSHVASPVTDAHHTLYTLESHDNAYHSTNYHTEVAGTGVVTVHNDVTSAGSGAIITTGERNALHPIVTSVYNLKALDDRDYKPNTSDSYGFVKTFFTSLGGMTGVADSDYQDLLILNTYTDSSGGDINALTFDKSTQLIKHWLADQAAATWGTPKTIAYVEDIHSEAHVLAITGPHTGELPLGDLASGVAGSIIIRGASDWQELAKGTSTYVLKMGATYPAWGQVGWTEVTGKPTEFTPISHDNTYHSTNYEAANANIQSHVGGTPPTSAHHVKTVKYTAGEVDARIVVQNTDPDGTTDIAVDALIATHVIAGHTLNQINNPSGDKEFNFANKHLHFKWVAPASGAHEGAFEIEASGAFSGDLMHIHQHTGIVGANTYMVFIECEHVNASCLHLEHGGDVLDFGANGLLVGADARITEFDTGTLDASDTKVPTSGTVKEAIDLLKEQSAAFPVSPSEGDFHYDEDDDSLYRYNAEALAWVEVGAGGSVASEVDNLGNHTATEDLDMVNFDLINVGAIAGPPLGGYFDITVQYGADIHCTGETGYIRIWAFSDIPKICNPVSENIYFQAPSTNWNTIHADDFTPHSAPMPLELSTNKILSIKNNEDDSGLDYDSIPEDTLYQEKDGSNKGYKMNKMMLHMIKTIQELELRIKTLEGEK